MLETLPNCLFTLDPFWRLRHRKKDRRVVSKTSDELLDIKILEYAQKLSGECLNGCAIGGLVRGSNAGICNGDDTLRNTIAVTNQPLSIICADLQLRVPGIFLNRVCLKRELGSLQRAGPVWESTSLAHRLREACCAVPRDRYLPR